METLERELLEHLGYGDRDGFAGDDYDNISQKYNTLDIGHKHEQKLYQEYGSVFFLKNFPEHTSPFWNMKRNEGKSGTARKIDVILSGMETIGSAERSCDREDMLNRFNSISDGMYAKTLYNQFGLERVKKEMDDFLSHTFIKRSGGGIGITRLISSMKKEGLL